MSSTCSSSLSHNSAISTEIVSVKKTLLAIKASLVKPSRISSSEEYIAMARTTDLKLARCSLQALKRLLNNCSGRRSALFSHLDSILNKLWLECITYYFLQECITKKEKINSSKIASLISEQRERMREDKELKQKRKERKERLEAGIENSEQTISVIDDEAEEVDEEDEHVEEEESEQELNSEDRSSDEDYEERKDSKSEVKTVKTRSEKKAERKKREAAIFEAAVEARVKAALEKEQVPKKKRKKAIIIDDDEAELSSSFSQHVKVENESSSSSSASSSSSSSSASNPGMDVEKNN